MNASMGDDNEFAPLETPRDIACSDRVGIGISGKMILRCEWLQPLIVFGPQRSGKTSSVVIPAVLEWKGPCLVTSVRYDVVTETLSRRAQLGEVFIFDPSGMIERAETQFAAHCVGWSPLDSIASWDDAVLQAGSLAEGTDMRTTKNDDFWLSQARKLLTPLLYAAAATGGTMSDVLTWVGMDPSDLIDELLARTDCDDPDWSQCIRRLMTFETYAPETYGSVCATVGSMLEVFDLMEVERRCTQTKRLPLDVLLDGGAHTLYMCAPPAEQRQFQPLFTALVKQVVKRTIDRNKNYKGSEDRAGLEVPLMLCLDEAGNIARLEELDTLATTAAGSGIQLISVFHDMSQLYASYSENRGRLIISNHRGKLFLPGNSDSRTGEFLTEQLGGSDVRLHRKRGWTSSDLRKLEREEALCLYGGFTPTLVEMRRWDQDPMLKALRRGRPETGPGDDLS